MAAVSPHMGRTTIQVDDETADLLWARKTRGESYDDVVRRLLAATDGRDGGATLKGATDGPTGSLPDSVPATVDDAAARAAIDAAVELVRERGPIQRAAIAEALADQHALGYEIEQVESRKGAWWRKTIRPGLKQAGAEYVNGRGWTVDGD
jgi:hypothetical protein